MSKPTLRLGCGLALCAALLLIVGPTLVSSTRGSVLAAPAGGCPLESGWSKLPFADPSRSSIAGYEGGATAFSESWTTPGLVLAGGVQGLYRSEDCGASWSRVYQPDVTPGESATALHMVTAVQFAPDGGILLDSAQGVLSRSADDGATWTPVEPPRKVIRNLVDFAPDGVAYAVLQDAAAGFPVRANTFSKLARSPDGGRTWQDLSEGDYPGFATPDPRDSAVVYGIRGGLLARSVDRGLTYTDWATFSSPVVGFAISPDANRFWVIDQQGGLSRSRDQGQSWRHFSGKPNVIGGLKAGRHDIGTLLCLDDLRELWFYREPPDD